MSEELLFSLFCSFSNTIRAFDVTRKLFALYSQKCPRAHLPPKMRVECTATTAAKKKNQQEKKNVIELIFVLFTEHFYNVSHKKIRKKGKSSCRSSLIFLLLFYFFPLFSWHFTRLERILRKRIKRRKEHFVYLPL